MRGIVSIVFIVLLFQIYTTMKNQKEYKNGGEVKHVFKQRSFLMKIIFGMTVLTFVFTIWTFNNFREMAFSNIPILCYLLVILYNYSRKIEVLSRGIFLSGKFLKWEAIEKVEVGPKNSLKLSLKNDRYKVYVVDQIEGVEILKSVVKKEMKINKKL